MSIVAAPKSENSMTYEEAVLYCTFCRYDGRSDWRMPTEAEWWNQHVSSNSWWQDRENNGGADWRVTPVRDVC